MSLACSSSAAPHYLVTSSSRRRARSKMAAFTAGAGDERWVALDKHTVLDILNDILSQPAAAAVRHVGDPRTPAVTSPELTSRGSASATDYRSRCCRSSPVSGISVDTSGLGHSGEGTESGWCVGCRQPCDCERDDTAVQNGQSLSSASHTADGGAVSVHSATELTTARRRRPSSARSVESPTRGHGDEAAVLVDPKSAVQHDGSPSTCRTHVRQTTKDQRVPHVDERDRDIRRQQSVTSSPVTSSSRDCFDSAAAASFSSSSDTHFTSATAAAEMSARASWVAIDKTLLCDVINRMLYRDVIFGFWNCRDSAFPFPVDSSLTGSSCGRRSCSPGMMTSTRCLRDGEITLSNLSCPGSFETEPEVPQRSLMTSLLPDKGSGDRVEKPLAPFAVAYLSSSKRRCLERDRRNAFPLPLYLETRSDNDHETTTDMAHSPSLQKWKSTMLLRMRRETSTSANRSPLSAFT